MEYQQPQQQQQQQQQQQYYQQYPQQNQQYYQQQPYQQYPQYQQYQQYPQYQQYQPQQQQQIQPYQQPQHQQTQMAQTPQGQPQERGLPPQPGQNAPQNEWQNSLMDCSPCESCLLGTWLPCILLGRTSERLRDPTMQSYDSLNNECIMMCGITYLGCGWIYAMMKRSEIRDRFGIEGSDFGDCCVAYWCTCCGLIQQDKEVIARTAGAQGTVVQPYQAPKEGMVMPQPQTQHQQGIQPAPTAQSLPTETKSPEPAQLA